VAAEDLNLTGISSLDQALARTKNGTPAISLARRLGLWTDQAHAAASDGRRTFTANLSELTPEQLSDLNGRWTADYGRLVELCGAIAGQEALLKVQLKSAQAAARARVVRNLPADAKRPSQQMLSDEAEQDAAVVDVSDQLALLSVLAAHAQAAKEATGQYLATISREITYRDAQLKARIY